MHFSKFFAAIGAASIIGYANAGVIETRAMTAQQVVDNINTITSMSQNLQGPANQINILSGALFLIGQGPFPQIIQGFNEIVTIANSDIQQMVNMPPFTVKPDEEAILSAFTDFVEVHQVLLSILIGKAGLLNDLPLVGPPVAEVLRQVEAVVDTIAFSLIAACPDASNALMEQKESLDLTLAQAIEKYTAV